MAAGLFLFGMDAQALADTRALTLVYSCGYGFVSFGRTILKYVFYLTFSCYFITKDRCYREVTYAIKR